jgi:heme A synthase
LLGAVLRPTSQAGLGLGAVTLSINPIGVFAQSLIASIVAALFVPITTVAVTLLYLDIRARHGEPVPAPGAPAPAPTQSAPG